MIGIPIVDGHYHYHGADYAEDQRSRVVDERPVY